MKTSLKTFLDDLYLIDPTLQAHEAEIIPLVEKLLASDPAVEPDTEFVKRLRMQLQDRAAELQSPATAGFSRWFYALGGAVTAAVIIPLVFITVNKPDTSLMPPATPSDSSALFGYTVTEEGKDAFGSLSDLMEGSSPPPTGGGGDSTRENVAAPEMVLESMPAPDMAMGSDAKMIAPYPMTKYTYVYAGEFPELSSTVAVYKRNPSSKSIPFSAIGSSLNLGNIDLTSFNGMKMDSVSFSQNQPYGYQMTVNLRDTAVSLDAQWDQWPMSKCQTDGCYQAERVKLADVPSEDDLIAAANAFIKDHAIDISHYGTPTVDMTWKRDYDRAPNKNDVWIPDQLRVLYPLVIDGHSVSDQSGMSSGISIDVHIKSRKVMHVYGIMSRNYAKSDYAGVSDSKDIKDYLAKLDNYAWMPESDLAAAETATVTLGEPMMGYSVYYKYDRVFRQEMLIPSLTFPVKEVKGGDPYFYRSYIVVPLASDMLKEQQNGGMPIPPAV